MTFSIMHNPPTLQRIPSANVIKALISESYGTYLVRRQSTNDAIISDIHISNRSRTPSHMDAYAILAVRVDQTLHKCPVMNYRLSILGSDGQQNLDRILDCYHSKSNQLENFTPLRRELIIPTGSLNWNLDPKSFRDINLTEGHFGERTLTNGSSAVWQRSGEKDVQVFIKSFVKTSSSFESQLKILKQLCFFPIVTLYGCYSDHCNDYLVFAHGGRSLLSVSPIRARTIESKMFKIVNIAFQIANAMIYLEKKNIVHCDLTASNVLIDSHGFVRIANFSHAFQQEEGKNNLIKSMNNNGVYRCQARFLAPECIPKSQLTHLTDPSPKHFYASFSTKSDVWAFGILLIQLMLKDPSKPYPHIEEDTDLLRQVVIDREIHPKPEGCNMDIYYILQQCWAYEPINRISFIELREKTNMLVSILR